MAHHVQGGWGEVPGNVFLFPSTPSDRFHGIMITTATEPCVRVLAPHATQRGFRVFTSLFDGDYVSSYVQYRRYCHDGGDPDFHQLRHQTACPQDGRRSG